MLVDLETRGANMMGDGCFNTEVARNTSTEEDRKTNTEEARNTSTEEARNTNTKDARNTNKKEAWNTNKEEARNTDKEEARITKKDEARNASTEVALPHLQNTSTDAPIRVNPKIQTLNPLETIEVNHYETVGTPADLVICDGRQGDEESRFTRTTAPSLTGGESEDQPPKAGEGSRRRYTRTAPSLIAAGGSEEQAGRKPPSAPRKSKKKAD